jgi:hypothetical protein
MIATAKILMFVLAMHTCSAQDRPPVDELLTNLLDDKLAAYSAGKLVEFGGDPRTVPALRAKFVTTRDKFIKQSISLAMLRLKVEEPAYYEYLASFAWDAVNSDAPNIFLLKDRRPAGLNPEFEEWCKLHSRNVSEETFLRGSGYINDMMILLLASDQRAAPIFRKGLFSNNAYVVLESVLGLGNLGNPLDIEPIIEVADRSPQDIDSGVVTALALFSNPRDREAIAKRLKGSRLYDDYLISVKAVDSRRAEVNTKPN